MDKRLLRFAGGQPVRSQDIEFLQEALNGATTNLAKAFGDTYILYGTLDYQKTSVVEGAVVIDGEIYKVPALGALGNNKLCYRTIDSDERTFYNGQKHKVVRTYEAYLSEDTGGAVAWIDLKTAEEPVDALTKKVAWLINNYPKAYEPGYIGYASSISSDGVSYSFNVGAAEEGDVLMYDFKIALSDSNYVFVSGAFASLASGSNIRTIGYTPSGAALTGWFDTDNGVFKVMTTRGVIKYEDCTGSIVVLKKGIY